MYDDFGRKVNRTLMAAQEAATAYAYNRKSALDKKPTSVSIARWHGMILRVLTDYAQSPYAGDAPPQSS